MHKNYSKKRKQFGGNVDIELEDAVSSNDMTVVNDILNNFWDEVTEQGQVEALHIAVIKNNLEIVKKLISKNPAIANIKSEQSNSTALTYAVIEGRDERIIQILVNNGGTISKMARGYRNDVPVERDVADAAEAAEEDARYNSGGYKSRKRRSQKNKRRTQKNKRRRSIKGRRRVKR